MSDSCKPKYFEQVPLKILKTTLTALRQVRRTKPRVVREPAALKTEPYSVPPERLDRDDR